MAEGRPWRTALVDDHAVVRAGVRTLLASDPDFDVVVEAATLSSARALVPPLRPDLVVMDLRLPDGSGLDLLPTLHALDPVPRIFVLSMHDEPAQVRQAVRLGVDGYATKESAGAELLAGCRAVMTGRRYLHPSLGMTLAATAPAELSGREEQVLRLLAEGHTNAEIAARMYVALRTVEAHRANLRARLGVSSRADLVSEARRRGLLDPTPG